MHKTVGLDPSLPGWVSLTLCLHFSKWLAYHLDRIIHRFTTFYSPGAAAEILVTQPLVLWCHPCPRFPELSLDGLAAAHLLSQYLSLRFHDFISRTDT